MTKWPNIYIRLLCKRNKLEPKNTFSPTIKHHTEAMGMSLFEAFPTPTVVKSTIRTPFCLIILEGGRGQGYCFDNFAWTEVIMTEGLNISTFCSPIIVSKWPRSADVHTHAECIMLYRALCVGLCSFAPFVFMSPVMEWRPFFAIPSHYQTSSIARYRDCILATLLGEQLLICKESAEGGDMGTMQTLLQSGFSFIG